MSGVGRRYAQALYSLSKEADSLQTSAEEAYRLLSWIRDVSDFESFVKNKFLKVSEVQAALKEISQQAELSSLMLSFLMVLAENGRLATLEACLTAFIKKIDEANDLLRGEVITVEKVPKSYLTQLKKALTHKFNKTIELTPQVDKAILGGIVLKVGPYLIDASLESRLSRLEARLKG